MMRRKIMLILMCIMINLSSALANGEYDWTKVINAIIQVESEGNAKAKSKDCLGILQIRPILVHDCNEFLKMKKSKKRFTLNDRLNAQKSKEMFILYQKRYNPTNNIEKAIRLWNGGCGYSVAKTENYLNKVLKHYNKGSL